MACMQCQKRVVELKSKPGENADDSERADADADADDDDEARRIGT